MSRRWAIYNAVGDYMIAEYRKKKHAQETEQIMKDMERFKEIEQRLNEKNPMKAESGDKGSKGKGMPVSAKAKTSEMEDRTMFHKRTQTHSAMGLKWEPVEGGQPPKRGKGLDKPRLAKLIELRAKVRPGLRLMCHSACVAAHVSLCYVVTLRLPPAPLLLDRSRRSPRTVR